MKRTYRLITNSIENAQNGIPARLVSSSVAMVDSMVEERRQSEQRHASFTSSTPVIARLLYE